MQKTKFSKKIDYFGIFLLCFLLSEGFFLSRWGVSLPAILAGFMLFCLFLLLQRFGKEKRKRKKEMILRKKIGGLLFLQRMMLTPVQKACEEIFNLFSLPLRLDKIRPCGRGILCSQGDKKIFFTFLPCHASETIFPGFVCSLQRTALRLQLHQVFLCTPAQFSPEALRQASTFPQVIHLDEKTLLLHGGNAFPASDEQIRLFEKQQPFPSCKWYSRTLSPEHMPRYSVYALFLMGLYFLTGFTLYAGFSIFLFILSVLCRILFLQKEKRRSS